MDRRLGLTLLLAAAVPASLVLALALGSAPIAWSALWAALTAPGADVAGTVIFELRLPRALAALAVGGLLALAGALLQVLLRNPLADPYVLGVSGGAACAALAALLAGIGGAWLNAAAFAGASLSVAIVFGLSRAGGGLWSPSRLLLTGVVIAAGWGAAVSLLLALAPGARVPALLFWLLGDLSYAARPLPALLVLAVALAAALTRARGLNVLARGELTAAALGEDPQRLRMIVYLVASAATAAAVALGGSIGFVGLVVPHLLRLAGLGDHRFLLPAAVLAGGAFLVLADTLARSLLSPMQLPVGVLTALLGVPLFLFLLVRSHRPGG